MEAHEIMEHIAAFDPFFSLPRYNGAPCYAGINWSYARFQSAKERDEYIKACRENGYRTRGEKTTEDGTFLVQYHHYAD